MPVIRCATSRRRTTTGRARSNCPQTWWWSPAATAAWRASRSAWSAAARRWRCCPRAPPTTSPARWGCWSGPSRSWCAAGGRHDASSSTWASLRGRGASATSSKAWARGCSRGCWLIRRRARRRAWRARCAGCAILPRAASRSNSPRCSTARTSRGATSCSRRSTCPTSGRTCTSRTTAGRATGSSTWSWSPRRKGTGCCATSSSGRTIAKGWRCCRRFAAGACRSSGPASSCTSTTSCARRRTPAPRTSRARSRPAWTARRWSSWFPSASSDDVEVLDALVHVAVLRLLAVQLDVEPHFVGRIGEAQRVLVADAAGLVQIEQRLVEGLHAQLARLLHDLLDLVDLALEDQVADQRRVEQDLDRRGAPLALAQRDQALRHHRLQVERQVHQQLLAALLREEVDDAVHRLVGVVGVQRAQRQVAGLGEGHRVLHHLAVADLADQDHVGRLAQGVLQRRLPRVGVDADLALGDDAVLVRVHVLDRVLDGDDVAVRVLVAVAEHGGERGGLARAGAADEQHQAALGHGDVLQHRRQ